MRAAATVLTLSRLPMAAAVWIDPDNPALLLTLMAAAAVTDVLDGWAARRADTTGSHTGAWLDPLCDKIFVVSSLVAVWVSWRPAWYVLPLVALREIVQVPTLLVIRPKRYDFHAALVGKATTAAQFAAVLAIVFWRNAVVPLALVAAALGLVSGLVYFRRAFLLTPLRGSP